MSLEFKPVNQHDLPRQIADRIRAAITDGTLGVDDRLPTEEELARRFDVSRPTIREALKRLAAQNLIRSRRGPTGGTFINQPDIMEMGQDLGSATRMLAALDSFSLEEIIQCRLELEQLCVSLAASNCKAADLEAMQAALADQRAALSQPESFCAADVAYHRALANATGNRLLAFLMYAVIEALQPVSNMVVFRYPERDLIIRQHEALLDALSAGNTATAQELIQAQIDTLSEQLQRARSESRRRRT
ncbi:MAG: FadR family transcriptional regulator [Oceanospirillaceae bacterium]|jgi:DNA-binding FadR family transcriptional regulator|uniref:FadR/GntR family transcriptional regulator n=1 Tax=Marinobacterium litorale TaxID=404770 RepID=UPI0003FB731A|nr:FadR/GntR family transcriptional regulator [Marinobacterium litorale]MBT00294.1 FadR family transcriptional regulator [Oceanospirillaceae bacterium]